jgi:hypothetical protein
LTISADCDNFATYRRQHGYDGGLLEGVYFT